MKRERQFSGMMLLVAVVLALAGALFFGTTTFADEITVAGDDVVSSRNAPSPDPTFGPVSEKGFDMTLPVVAVFTGDVGGNPGYSGVKHYDRDANTGGQAWVLEYRDNPVAFKGAKFHVAGTQKYFKANVQRRNEDDYLGTSMISGPTVTVNVRNIVKKLEVEHGKPVTKYLQPFVFQIHFADGKVAWGGIPGFPDGQYVVRNKAGKIQSAVIVDVAGGRIEPPGEAGKAVAAMRE